MGRFDLVTRKGTVKRKYQLIFHLGHGIYQCFPTEDDFFHRNKKVDEVLSFVFEQSLKQPSA